MSYRRMEDTPAYKQALTELPEKLTADKRFTVTKAMLQNAAFHHAFGEKFGRDVLEAHGLGLLDIEGQGPPKLRKDMLDTKSGGL